MNVLATPLPTKLAAAIVAAGVVSAGSVVALPTNQALPAITADVANASVITDALNNLGDVVDGVSLGSAISAYSVLALPYYVGTVGGLAAQTPSLAPSLFSWLVQYYANPSTDYPYNTLAQNLFYAIDEVAGVLPPPVGGAITSATTQIANGINNALSGLPDPAAGANAVYPFWNTDLGRVVSSVNDAITGPVWMLYSTASYLGYLPAEVEASIESAIQNPAQIPGLVSNLIYGLMSPDNGLFGDLLYYSTVPVTNLPGPIGELTTNAVAAITDGVNNLLAALPAPITPTPFPSAVASATASKVAHATAPGNTGSLPAASVTVADAITVPSGSLAEKPAATTDSSAIENPAPQPSTPTADPGADPKLPTNAVRSGNKVKPGDKFAGNVTDKDKDKGKRESRTVAGDKTTASDSATGTSAASSEAAA